MRAGFEFVHVSNLLFYEPFQRFVQLHELNRCIRFMIKNILSSWMPGASPQQEFLLLLNIKPVLPSTLNLNPYIKPRLTEPDLITVETF